MTDTEEIYETYVYVNASTMIKLGPGDYDPDYKCDSRFCKGNVKKKWLESFRGMNESVQIYLCLDCINYIQKCMTEENFPQNGIPRKPTGR